MSKFKINDKVEVIDSGQNCSTCTSIFDGTGLNKDRYHYGYALSNGSVGRIVYYSGDYGDDRYIVLSNDRYYVIVEKGLKLKEDSMNQKQLYLKMHEACPLKEGDHVRFTREWEYGEFGCFTQVNEAAEHVEKTGIISEKDDDIYRIEINERYWSIPFFCLEIIEKSEEKSEIDQYIDSLDFDCDEQKELTKKVANKVIEICLQHD